MLNGKKIIVVMPAYNAERTLRQTFSEIPADVVDDVILVDDNSSDSTALLANEIGITTFLHEKKYGLRQKSKNLLRRSD